MVEFALILPVLLLILVGIVEFGLVFYNVSSVRQGVRETGRQGSVANWGTLPNPTCDGLIGTWEGSAPSTNIQTLMCTAKKQLGVPNSVKLKVYFVQASDLSTPTSTWALGNGLVICAYYPLNSVTGLFSPFLSGRSATTKSLFRIESATDSGGSPILATGGAERIDATDVTKTWASKYPAC